MEFPQQFGKYTLLRRLATGGMAEIFLARQGGMGGFEKEVVVKRLLPNFASQDDRVQMFLEEGRIAAALTHPNIAQIFDLGREQDDYYIAMEYVHGVDLRRVCSQGIAEGNYLPLQHAVRVVAEVLDALHYAHTRSDKEGKALGIVHQDVTPTNILVTFDGGVKLVDFGVARDASSPQEITGMIAGKAGYMSPEQVTQAPVDARADVFAAGINLYEITVGRRLFRGTDGEDTLAVVAQCEVPPPRSVNPEFPERLEKVIMRALARDPEARYPDARAMQIALEDFLAGEGMRSTAGMLANYMQTLFRETLELERARASEPAGGLVNLLEPSPSLPATDSNAESALPGMTPAEGFPTGDTQLSTIPSALLEATPDPEAAPGPEASGATASGATASGVAASEPEQAESAQPAQASGPGSMLESVELDDSRTEMVASLDVPEADIAPSIAPDLGAPAPMPASAEEQALNLEAPTEMAPGPATEAVVTVVASADEINPLLDPPPPQPGPMEGPTVMEPAAAPVAPATGLIAELSTETPAGPAVSAPPEQPLVEQTPSPEIPVFETPNPRRTAPMQSEPVPPPAAQPPVSAPPAVQPATQTSPAAQEQPMRIPESAVKGSGESARLSASALLMPPDLTAASDAEKQAQNKPSNPPPTERSLSMSLRIRRSYAGLVILLLVAGGGFGLYYLMTQTEGPKLGKTANIFEQPKLGQTTEAPPPPPLRKAILRITSEPLGARVVVNGNLLDGKTPTSVETYVGRPSTVRVLLGGFLPAERRVQVAEGGADVDFKLKEGLPAFGALKVETAPEGAQIEINGTAVGETPKSFPRVGARNDISLKLTKEGFYPQHVRFKVSEKENRNIAIRMVPDAGPRALSTIMVETIPSGALVFDMSEPGAKVPLGRAGGREPLRVSRKPNTPLRLRAELDGYDPAEWDLDVVESHYTIYIRMTAPAKFFGKLTVKPAKKKQKLTVYVGNKEIGKTPVVDHPIEEGEQKLVIFDEETRARTELKLNVEKDGTITKMVELTEEGEIVVK